MKTGYKITFFLLLFMMMGCTSKTVTYFNKITLLGKTKKEVKNPLLQKIADQLATDTNATLLYAGDAPPQKSSNITLFVTDKYLKIIFNAEQLFSSTQTNLSDETRYYLNQIIPVLKEYPGIIVQIIGHAYEEGSPKEMQHYADTRAISVAEYLYTAGLRQEILAKGCGDQVPKQICPKNKPHLLCAMHNRRIEIFIYTAKNDVITRCR
jgi:outer membrane protein OmpA-like peptidoglycan-associated protein